MTFSYTDEQLNNLNKGKNVYSVNAGFVNRVNAEGGEYQYIGDKPDDQLLANEENKVKTSDGQQFKVIKTYSDPKTGFDGMLSRLLWMVNLTIVVWRMPLSKRC